ncbi:DUF4199 family protein [Tunicatimonas pelagia]|uniref:DUF4199 family protein n=1 Tax=Tunicatimonas pelagia TaxID=931531 RepID=UPI0026652C8D|nr:DUF4199 family protein [Tunicatimonas pelagia]WKN41197.1 DUF4199 family protein [Tunicatimonas pelagia]
MSEESPNREIFSVGLKYGLVGSVIAIGLFFAMKWGGENPLIWTTPKLVVYSIIFILFPLLALAEFRRYHWEGKWKFWYGLVLGIVVYGTICLSTFSIDYIAMVADSSLVASYQEASLQSLESKQQEFLEQFGEVQYAQTREAVSSITAVEIALDDLLKKLLLGFFLTATIALAVNIISSLRSRSVSNS